MTEEMRSLKRSTSHASTAVTRRDCSEVLPEIHADAASVPGLSTPGTHKHQPTGLSPQSASHNATPLQEPSLRIPPHTQARVTGPFTAASLSLLGPNWNLPELLGSL